VKVSGAAWQGDGFYYSRYPKPEGSALAAKNENHQVFFHQLNTLQSADRLVYEDAQNPQRFHNVGTTDDERFVLLTISDRGKGKDGNALFFMDAQSARKTFAPVVADVTDFSYGVVDNDGDRLLILTNENAPNNKVVGFDTKKMAFSTLIAERPQPIAENSVSAAGGKLFVEYAKDVASQVQVFDYAGKPENEIALPAIGSAGGFGARKTTSLCSTASPRSPSRPPSTATILPRAKAPCSGHPRSISTQWTTKQSRCFMPVKTERRCRCF
jgi:prolyl oligopeptidase